MMPLSLSAGRTVKGAKKELKEIHYPTTIEMSF